MKYCEKCGWKMEYKPRSYREHINEIIGKQNKRGYWECPNCGSIKKVKIGRRVKTKNEVNKIMPVGEKDEGIRYS